MEVSVEVAGLLLQAVVLHSAAPMF